FRVAKNPRVVAGVRIQDYDNYEASDLKTKLTALPGLFEAGSLKKISEILTVAPCITVAQSKPECGS
ncbi:MAG: hypothetical protein AAFQ82_24990, partial [Myxococcota bacterium]